MGEPSCRLKSSLPSFLRVGEENITQDEEDLSEKMGTSSKCGCLSAQARSSLTFRDHQSLLKSIHLFEGERHQKLRFTEAQTQHLEATFERQPRPDAPKKRRLAAELGVQVRQVEVWFQNRRARGKSSKCIANKDVQPEQQQQQQQQQVVASEREAYRQRCQELLVHNQQLRSLIQNERIGDINVPIASALQLQLAFCNLCKQV